MNKKEELDALNRRLHHYLTCTYHTYQGLWWPCPGYHAKVKDK